MIQYFSIDGKEYPFLLANKQLRRFLGERKLKISQIDEVLLDMDQMHQLFVVGVISGLNKLKMSEKVTSATVDDWNEDGHLPWSEMVRIINSAIKPNMGIEDSDEPSPGSTDEGN